MKILSDEIGKILTLYFYGWQGRLAYREGLQPMHLKNIGCPRDLVNPDWFWLYYYFVHL